MAEAARQTLSQDDMKGLLLKKLALPYAAGKGRHGDNRLGHLSDNDVVVPTEDVTPAIRKKLKTILGDKLDRYTVGHKANSTHPDTGLPEFWGEGGDTGGGGAAGEGGQGGPGDPAGSPGDSGAGAGTGGGSGPSGSGGSSGMGGEVGQGHDTGPTSSVGTDMSGGLSGMGGEVGTGHSLGSVPGEPGPVVGGFGEPTTGIGFVDRSINDLSNLSAQDIMGTIANLGLGMIPGVGIANTIGKATGLGTIGGNMAAHGVDQPGNPAGNVAGSAPGMAGTSTDPGAGPATQGGDANVVNRALGNVTGGTLNPVGTPGDYNNFFSLLDYFNAIQSAPGPR